MSDELLYRVLSVWPDDGPPSEPAEIGQTFLATLDALQRVDPLRFNNWELSDLEQEELIPLELARTEITDIVEHGVARNDYGEPYPAQGYWVHAYDGAHGPKEKLVSVTVKAANAYGCHAQLEIGDLAYVEGDSSGEGGHFTRVVDLALVTFARFRGALLAFVAHWPCRWAAAYVIKRDYWKASLAPGVPPHPDTSFMIPWIAYLPSKFARGFTPPPHIPNERTPDGGLLMWATEERLDPTNPEHMSRSRAIAEIMNERTDGGSVLPEELRRK